MPQSTVSTILLAGDEIGVFTEHGTLCGAGVYNGENLAITVWGDDATTNNVQEGMLPGEIYRMKVWKAAEQQEYTAIAEFSVGDNMYQVDDLEVISSVQLTTALRKIPSAGIAKLHVYPNPARATVYLDIETQESMKVQISVCQPDGRWVIDVGDIDLPAGSSTHRFVLPPSIPTGVYFLKIRTTKGITSRRIFIENY